MPAAPEKKIFVLIVAVIFIGGGFGLYYALGAPDIIPMLAARDRKIAEIKTAIRKNEDSIKADPDNLKAWVEMGGNFMEAEQFSAAAHAFKQAVLLSKGNPDIIMAYAEAQINAADGKVTDEAKKSLDMVIMQKPQNAPARYYLAVWNLQEGHLPEAMKMMKELYHSLPDDSPLKARINEQIGRN